jgi:hypothetical protein
MMGDIFDGRELKMWRCDTDSNGMTIILNFIQFHKKLFQGGTFIQDDTVSVVFPM